MPGVTHITYFRDAIGIERAANVVVVVVVVAFWLVLPFRERTLDCSRLSVSFHYKTNSVGGQDEPSLAL